MSETQDAQIRNTIPANIAKPLSDAFVRIFRNSLDGLYYGKRFSGAIELIGSASGNGQILVNNADLVQGFLANKLIAGPGISFAVVDLGGGNLALRITNSSFGLTDFLFAYSDNTQFLNTNDRVTATNVQNTPAFNSDGTGNYTFVDGGQFELDWMVSQDLFGAPNAFGVRINNIPIPGFTITPNGSGMIISQGVINVNPGDVLSIVNEGINPSTLTALNISHQLRIVRL